LALPKTLKTNRNEVLRTAQPVHFFAKIAYFNINTATHQHVNTPTPQNPKTIFYYIYTLSFKQFSIFTIINTIKNYTNQEL
jgi:hypothetical protein